MSKSKYAYIIGVIDSDPTVGENIIATTKIRNYYGAIQSSFFPILR